jgi:hypothetical protein
MEGLSGKGYLPSSVLRRISASRVYRDISHTLKAAALFDGFDHLQVMEKL